MDSERWKRIEELYHSAEELPDEQRSSFLDDACRGDQSLAEEVESLLKHGATPHSLLDKPAVAIVAKALAAEQAQPPTLRLDGKTLSHYRVLEAIGQGGMGIVYKAQDLKLRRYVALKLLPESLARDRQALQRFEREAQAASALNHPNICTVYEIDEAEGRHFIAIELLDGETLKERIARGALQTGEILQIAIEICDALEAAHAAGIIHRDVKPANIFLTRHGSKVLDFGVAKRIGLELAKQSVHLAAMLTVSVDLNLTSPGAAVGTIAYMSPEQAAGESVDIRADIFSLGAVLYEMSTGRLPFPGKDVGEVISAIKSRTPVPLEQLNPKAPSELGRIIAKAMQKDRCLRYQHAAEMKADLQTLHHRLGSKARWRTSLVAPLAILALLLAVAAVCLRVQRVREWVIGKTSTGLQREIKSLAVLPLDNLTGDPTQDYFVDGMTDSLITNLTKIGSLRVISRTSAMHYKGLHKALPEIARELKVNAVVEGSVIRSGNRVRISAQLVDAARDQNLWAQDYERDLQDVLRLQNEVAWDVVKQIQIKLTPEEQQRLVSYGHCAPNAHDLYLQGMYHWFKAEPEEYEKGYEYFRDAVAADPACAEAYEGLGYYYSISADEGLMLPAEGWPKARMNAQKSVELDPNETAYMTIAATTFFYDWKFREGLRQAQSALEKNPQWADDFREYAIYLRVFGRTSEAIVQAKKALELDPFSASMRASLAWEYYYAHQWDEAINQFKVTLQMEPSFLIAHEGLAKCYQQKKMGKEAIQQFVSEMRASGADQLAEQIESTYQSMGYEGAIRALYLTKLQQYQQLAKEAYVSPLFFADLYALLGEKDEAFKYLEEAYQERQSKLTDLKLDPDYDNIRSDPRFAALVKRIGLP
jgi:eukaryotic-like serine/threonine-protein kinase